MTTNDNTDMVNFEFSVGMEIPYEIRFLGLALECMTEFFVGAGCVSKESKELRLALEETLAFLIRSYPGSESWERIRMEFQLQTDSIAEISITNAGPPVHLDRIPKHNPENPEDSDGLWYFLASKVVDELSFKNQGKNGWLVIIRKSLSEVLFENRTPANDSGDISAPKRSFTTRLAVPDDAAALVDLTYDTYRYSYPSDDFYHVSKLRQALENREIISIVVESEGALVGNSSLAFFPETPRCGYSGSLMVKRSFRQSRAILYLLKEVKKYISNSSEEIDLYYATTVTTHTGSQKAGVKTGFSPLALLFSICTEVDLRGMKVSSNDRITFLLCVCFTSSPKMPVVYLPERHHAVMSGLLAQAGYNSILSCEEVAPVDAHSGLAVTEDDGESCAYIELSRLGLDFVERIQKRIFGLKAKGMQAVIVLIPAWRPIPPALDQEMARLNAFFGGIKPVSAEECYLVYCTLSRTVDFDKIRIVDPLAENLKEHCRILYQEVLVEDPE
ncbi:ATP-binding protein [Desulfovibrio gilichinskyi]|nr:ATP-binding protein [Desulfovibrio gilichinskyi]